LLFSPELARGAILKPKGIRMLFFDLLQKKGIARTWLPLSFSFFGLVFGLFVFFHPFHNSEELSDANTKIHAEDQQTIIAALDRLEKKYPEFHSQVLELEETLLRNPELAQLQKDSVDSKPVKVQDRRLVFSSAFFQSDPIAQETFLIDLLLATHPELKSNSALARSKSFIGTGESSE
jgi:hypothetical protein